MAAKRVFISGKVQGVSFRFHTHEKARALGLRGWVRNLEDGRVEILASGPADRLDELVRWARTGPPAARVDGVMVEDVAESEARDLEAFHIRRDG